MLHSNHFDASARYWSREAATFAIIPAPPAVTEKTIQASPESVAHYHAALRETGIIRLRRFASDCRTLTRPSIKDVVQPRSLTPATGRHTPHSNRQPDTQFC